MATLKKITKLKNLGIYDDFSWTGDLPELKQYNLVYGWNGTGKTTLSKLLGALNTGSHSDFDTLEYSVLDNGGNTHSNGTLFSTPIRVFNSDFITANVDFDTQSSKTITVILGEENKEALEAIEADEKQLAEVELSIDAKTKEHQTKSIARGAEFTNIAKAIGQGTQGAIVRNYNKTHAEVAFKAMSGKELLSDDELAKVSKSVSQETMAKQDELSLDDVADKIATAITEAETLLNKTVEASIIARLKDNPDIADWVETGLAIHEEHKGKDCEFCGKPLDSSRIAELTAHFNEADAKLKAEVDTLVETLQRAYATVNSLEAVDKMNFYQEYRDDYETKAKAFAGKLELALGSITEFGKLIKSKKLHTTEVVTLKDTPKLDELDEAIKNLNDIISEHNKKTDNFEEQRKADSQKIERHHLSTIFDSVKKLDEEIENLATELTSLKNGVEGDEDNIGKAKLLVRIAENKAKISSSHKACELLNASLKTFLGHDEVTFDVNDDDTGYQILRRGSPAKSLSEGECTAIAFIFFVTQLQDESFDPATGIIVIDDPVSSLDANSQFQAFSFLKNATKDASQLFIFTHNFDFLKLALGWVKNSRIRGGYSLLMVKNTFSIADGSRTAFLTKLDPALEKFESEYHYLFNVLYAYKDDGTIENAYKMPNIARKLLDSFLMFCIPKNISTYERLQELTFDEEKKSAVYKFVNDQSHITGAGFDPSLVPEAQKCIKYLLELMETTFPTHYAYLVETAS